MLKVQGYCMILLCFWLEKMLIKILHKIKWRMLLGLKLDDLMFIFYYITLFYQIYEIIVDLLQIKEYILFWYKSRKIKWLINSQYLQKINKYLIY
jgi:hypothetical protein